MSGRTIAYPAVFSVREVTDGGDIIVQIGDEPDVFEFVFVADDASALAADLDKAVEISTAKLLVEAEGES